MWMHVVHLFTSFLTSQTGQANLSKLKRVKHAYPTPQIDFKVAILVIPFSMLQLLDVGIALGRCCMLSRLPIGTHLL